MKTVYVFMPVCCFVLALFVYSDGSLTPSAEDEGRVAACPHLGVIKQRSCLAHSVLLLIELQGNE